MDLKREKNFIMFNRGGGSKSIPLGMVVYGSELFNAGSINSFLTS